MVRDVPLSSINLPSPVSTQKKRGRTGASVDNKTLGGRIREAREKANLSARKLAEIVKISHASIIRTEKNQTNPDNTTLIILAQALQSNFGLDWLKPYVKGTPLAVVPKAIAQKSSEPRPTSEAVIERFLYESGNMFVPDWGEVAAGAPLHARPSGEVFTVPIGMTRRGRQAVALRVVGDSMKDALIETGSIIICHKIDPEEVRNGKLVVVDLLDRGVTLKTWHLVRGRLELHPANNAFEPMVIKPSDVLSVFAVTGIQRFVK